jgi:hypothetical protein
MTAPRFFAALIALALASLACGATPVPPVTATAAPTFTPAPTATPAPGGIAILIVDSVANRAYFAKIAQPQDRYFLYGRDLAAPSFDAAQLPKVGAIVVSWPSWQTAQQNEAAWAPYADVFDYDVENDTPQTETADLDSTLTIIRARLNEFSVKYGHTIRLMCGLNFQFGAAHVRSLAHCDEVYIHADEFLRTYPARDKLNRTYVNWAIGRAVEARTDNPSVGLWFSVLAPGMDPLTAQNAAADLGNSMLGLDMDFDGFALWADASQLQSLMDWLR